MDNFKKLEQQSENLQDIFNQLEIQDAKDKEGKIELNEIESNLDLKDNLNDNIRVIQASTDIQQQDDIQNIQQIKEFKDKQDQEDIKDHNNIQNVQQTQSLEQRVVVLEDQYTSMFEVMKRTNQQRFKAQIQKEIRQGQLINNRKLVKQKRQDEEVGEEEFLYTEECFTKLANIQFKDYYKTFKKHKDVMYNRLYYVLVTDIEDIAKIKYNVILLFSFHISSLTIFQYNQQCYYIMVKLQTYLQFKLSFVEKTEKFILINKSPKKQDIGFIEQHFLIKYTISQAQIVYKNLQLSYHNKSKIAQQSIIESLTKLKKIKLIDHLIILNDDVISFVICLEKVQKIVILDYFYQYGRPSITVIDEDLNFQDVKEEVLQNNRKVYIIEKKSLEEYKY